ncbi:hypothetical protein M1437_00720 [Patescibacteria group bacterium]|nr:hypothetical protein [Patescibacteria group bacterium]
MEDGYDEVDRKQRSAWIPLLTIVGILVLGALVYGIIAGNRNTTQDNSGVTPGIGGGPGEISTFSPSPISPVSSPSDSNLMPLVSPTETPTPTPASSLNPVI